MRLETIKKDSQLVLNGIKFDVQWADNAVAQVTASDDAGNLIVFKKESYDFRVLVKAKPKTEKKYLLKGSVAGVPVEAIYGERYEANDAKDEFQRKLRSDEDAVLSVEEVQVSIED